MSDETITPAGFIDRCTFDDRGDTHGPIQVDDAYRLLRVSNCINSHHHHQQYQQPAIYFLRPAIDPAVAIENTVFWEAVPPTAEVGGEDRIGYRFEDTVTMDPRYADADRGDFALPSGSPLFTRGEDGGPVGDPRWTSNRLFTGSLHIPSLHRDWLYRLEGSSDLRVWIRQRAYTPIWDGIPWPVRDTCPGEGGRKWFFRLRREPLTLISQE